MLAIALDGFCHIASLIKLIFVVGSHGTGFECPRKVEHTKVASRSSDLLWFLSRCWVLSSIDPTARIGHVP